MAEGEIRVVHLSEAGQAERACPCMTEGPVPWALALEACRQWMTEHAGKTVHGLHLEDAGEVVGHVYYTASQDALIPYRVEPGVAVVHCEWVQRRHQGKGYAHALCESLTRRAEAEGYKGIVVAATDEEQCMHHRHFACRGYEPLSVEGPMHLMYRPLTQETIDVQPLPLRIAPRRQPPIEVIAFSGGFCPFEAATSQLAISITREFGSNVKLTQVAASRRALEEYGVASGVYVNGMRMPGGEPEEAIRRAIAKELERVGRR